MSYPKNTASPRALRAKVTNRSNGAPITSGVTAFHHHGTTRTAVAGDAAEHVGNGTWSYTPVQAETNYDEFGIEFYHASAVANGPQVTVITDAAAGPAAGAAKVTLRFTLPDGTPIADADTWITNDSDGRNIVDGTYQTNSQGRVTFLLDDGVEYYAWLQKDGVMAIDGEAFTAVKDA